MRVIFVPVADRPECAQALKVAFDLGQRLQASLWGCHIRPHEKSKISLPHSLFTSVDEEAAWEAAWRAKKRLRSHVAAESLFAKIAERHGYQLGKRPAAKPTAAWMEKAGSPAKVLSIMGPVSDLLVVSRPEHRGGKLARLFMQAALFHSGRPVLVLPNRGTTTVGHRISIAWNQSVEAARAVAASLPLLQQAEQVSIVSSGPENRPGPKSQQLANYLSCWGIKSTRVKAPKAKSTAAALERTFFDSDSDLLIMGAYSRSRLREQVFGGVTEHMLRQAGIPVLLLHG